MITTLLENNETKLQGLGAHELHNPRNYSKPYYFFTQVNDKDGYSDTIVHINAKFKGYKDIDSRHAFANFVGTLAEFDDLLIQNEEDVEEYDLRFRFLTSDEVARKKMPNARLRNKWTDRAEAKRYLSSSFR